MLWRRRMDHSYANFQEQVGSCWPFAFFVIIRFFFISTEVLGAAAAEKSVPREVHGGGLFLTLSIGLVMEGRSQTHPRAQYKWFGVRCPALQIKAAGQGRLISQQSKVYRRPSE